jgi:hypothetical protein
MFQLVRLFCVFLLCHKAALRGWLPEFLKEVAVADYSLPDIAFAIGRIVKDLARREMIAASVSYGVDCFENQCAGCRRAMDAWSVVGRRNGVVKDVRLMIAKLIWEERDEAKYDMRLLQLSGP